MAIRILMLLAAWAPGVPLLWLVVFRRRFPVDSELVWIAVLLGACSGIPAAGLERLFELLARGAYDPVEHAIGKAAMVGLCEEGAKLAVLSWIVLRHWEFRSAAQALPLGAAVGIGFALFENLFYVLGGTDWRITATLRAVSAVPLHALAGLIMGYLAARALMAPPARHAWLIAAFIVPALLHAAYDAPLMYAGRIRASEFPIVPAVLAAIVLCTALVAAILCWRHLVRPAPERSAA